MSGDRTVELSAGTLERYARFSLFNSPYPAHDEGRAIDLYPGGRAGEGFDGEPAPSPVAGRVLSIETVRAPAGPVGIDRDYLIVISCTAPNSARGLAARILHVDPSVEPGDEVGIGDSLGTLVRTGFFDPWVGAHLHVGFRPLEADHRRASGSLPVTVGADLRPVPWDGTGRVAAVGETYAVLRGSGSGTLAGIGADGGGVLDGGLPHYAAGGLLGGPQGPVSFGGERVGVADGRTVAWDDLGVRANGDPATGLSLSCGLEPGVTVVSPGHSLEAGERVEVTLEREKRR
ncbi:hypothetical protein [Saliphagus sp. LR7]|uniref:hypothetical protein n=1 Tax=Saliphagus sp. LR7 TaxID=2282654 RepID=UPI000DF833AD|nr:hypothetical protein [Saliphagus sp. LR7]